MKYSQTYLRVEIEYDTVYTVSCYYKEELIFQFLTVSEPESDDIEKLKFDLTHRKLHLNTYYMEDDKVISEIWYSNGKIVTVKPINPKFYWVFKNNYIFKLKVPTKK